MLTFVTLREVFPADADTLFEWENNPDNWQISDTQRPFLKSEIIEFVNQKQNLKSNLQQRFMICLNENAIGCIDLFEFDVEKKRAGVGVLIADKTNRNKGYAEQSIHLLIDKCRNELDIVHLFCNIFKDNMASIRLFEKCGFQFIDQRNLNNNDVNYYEKTL